MKRKLTNSCFRSALPGVIYKYTAMHVTCCTIRPDMLNSNEAVDILSFWVPSQLDKLLVNTVAMPSLRFTGYVTYFRV